MLPDHQTAWLKMYNHIMYVLYQIRNILYLQMNSDLRLDTLDQASLFICGNLIILYNVWAKQSALDNFNRQQIASYL